MLHHDEEGYPFAVPNGALRPPRSGVGARRAYAANLLGTVSLTLQDRLVAATRELTGRTAHAPAALVTLLWYPDRPVGFLAERLGITHPGAVQLAQRLGADGLVERIPGQDGRTTLLALTAQGEGAALAVLQARRQVLTTAVRAVPPEQLAAVAEALEAMLASLTSDLLTGEQMCRLCDELACPDARCPVERAEPAPPGRRGLGYGV